MSAAAGSGKTAVLVERIIQMITEGENPKDIRPPACHDFYPGGSGGDAGADPGGDSRKHWNRSRRMNICQQQAVAGSVCPDHDDRQLLPAYHAGTF